MTSVRSAVILAAGLGSRLKWLTQRQPKALMPVAGTPAIIRVIRRLVAAGIGDIAINLHHHADSIRKTLGNGQRWGARLYYSYEPLLLDSGGGLRQAMRLLPEAGDFVLLHNADIIADADFSVLHRCAQGGDCALMMVKNPAHHRQGDFVLHRRRLQKEGEGRRLTFGGISCWRTSTVQCWPSGQPFPLTACIQQAIQAHACCGYYHQGYWFDIGRAVDLFRTSSFLTSRSDHAS